MVMMVVVTARFLRRYVTTILLGLFCLFMAFLTLDICPSHHHHESQVLPEEAKNTNWYNENVMEVRMAWRRRTLKEACSRYGLDVPGNDSLHKANAWEFLINKEYHIIWCNVFKVASSSWLYNFNILAGYSPEDIEKNIHEAVSLARKKYKRPSVKELRAALNNSLAFLIVRHPLERLLSAYRDKIQHAVPNSMYDKMRHKIIQEIGKIFDNEGKQIQDKNNPKWPNFSEFVDFIIQEHQKGNEFDVHWAPITNFCSPCQIEFDMILKFDTLIEDQKYLIDTAGIGHLVKTEWRNPSNGPRISDMTREFYSQLTLSQLLQLYNIYKFDFELFDYSLNNYLEIVIIDNATKVELV